MPDLSGYPTHAIRWIRELPDEPNKELTRMLGACDAGLSCGDRIHLTWDDSRQARPFLGQQLVCPGALTGGCFVNVPNPGLRPLSPNERE